MDESWISHRFSLGNPRSDGAADLPRLLRRLAQEIEDRGIQPLEVDDLTFAQDATSDGPWFSATLYWTPNDRSARPEAEPSSSTEDGMTAPSERPAEQARLPVSHALPGVHLHPLPPGETIVSALALIRTRDIEDEPGWYTRATEDYNRVEFFGALTAYVAHLRDEEAAQWSADDDAPHPRGDVGT